MGPSRRTPSNQNSSVQSAPSVNSNTSQRHQKPQRHRPQQPSLPPPPSEHPNMGMSPASRYNHNLKVLRRRDPSIVSIFDQFSHVCVYHHNGKKWEKQGFEGSMFLYERESYPPYGFYILNRMGMDDYIQRLYPEDDIGAHGSYLMLRSYPDFTTRRLSLARSSAPDEPPHKFSDVYAIPNLEKLLPKEKGRSQTVGLWMFATDAREPMIDVMMRLHSYIKKNIPYPEEFRYGPDRPPPPNPHLRTTSTSTSPSQDDVDTAESPPSYHSESHSRPNIPPRPDHTQAQGGGGHFSANHPSQAYINGGVSELDKLFAKLGPTGSTPLLASASAAASSSSLAQSQTQIPNSTSKMTVESLFAALGGTELAQPNDDSPPPVPASNSNRGLALLDSIFASAGTGTPPLNQSNANHNPLIFPPTLSSGSHIRPLSRPQTPPEPESIIIYSPTPTSTTLPQILTQDVISTLLGLPPSRSASAAPTATSTSSTSTSREGGDEDDGDIDGSGRGGSGGIGSDGGYSESSTVLDPDADEDAELQAAGASAGRPLLSLESDEEEFGTTNRNGRIHGDVTPRAPPNGYMHGMRMSTLPSLGPGTKLQIPLRGGSGVSKPIEPASSTSTIRAPSRPQSQQSHARPQPIVNTARPLIPFEADSALWPYPRAPLDDRSVDQEDDIVELDFEDTSALSDPDVFRKVLQGKKKKSKWAQNGGGDESAGEGLNGDGGDGNGKEKGKGRKKGKKERAEEREREREEIERSWDVPGPAQGPGVHAPLRVSVPSPSPSPSPAPTLPPFSSETPTTARPLAGQQLHHHSFVNGKGKDREVNMNGILNADVVKESLLAAVSAPAQKPVKLERNKFVREVLTLIHTDKSFVDTLWQDYMARLE